MNEKTVAEELQRDLRILKWAVAFLLVAVIIGTVVFSWDAVRREREIRRVANQSHKALCAFKDDLQQRVSSGNAYLRTHPQGIAGVTASEIRVSIFMEERTLHTLKALQCPKEKT